MRSVDTPANVNPSKRRPGLRLGLTVLLLGAVFVRSRAAHAASFQAPLDREAVAPGEPFIFQLTLTVADENVEDFRPPDFHGLEVQSAPSFPSRSTNMQIGGGQTSIQNGYTWTFQLVLPAGKKGAPSIGAAHVRVAGRDLSSNPVQLRVGAPGAPPQNGAARRGQPGPGGLFQRFFGGSPTDDRGGSDEVASSSAAFIRVVPDKTRVFVGEQLTVGWYLYLTQSQNRYQPVSEPHTDGFWSEDIPSTNPQGRLSFTEQRLGGRTYNVAVLFKKALFPLGPGKLTVTPMEAEVSQVDFFGAPVQVKRLKSDPLVVEALALPRQGQPATGAPFDPGNVGRYQIAATVDRASVSVGDAVTLKVAVTGTGNVRNVQPPAIPPLAGWKIYEPKVEVSVNGGETVSGTKTVEWLMRPERAGRTTVPPLALDTFDPAAKRYLSARSQPIEILVTGEAAGGPVAGGPPPVGGGVENVIGGTIRPIRVRARPTGEIGVAFLNGAGLAVTVVTPPVALALLALYGRARERLGRDSQRNRRRRVRSMARRRLRAAEVHRAAGRAGDFYLEIERVLRETLSERLRTELGGLTLDELGSLLAARGLATAEVASVIGTLRACDEARFSGAAASSPEALTAALARAEALIDQIERAPFAEEARA